MNQASNQFSKQGQWIFSLNALRYSHVFRLLFSHPKLACALLAMRPFWGKTLLTALALCIVGSIFLTINAVPEYGADIRQGTQFVLDKLGTVKFADGAVNWTETNESTYTSSTNLPHLRLDIVKSWSEFTPPANSTRHQGLVLCKEGIGFWMSASTGELLANELMIPAAKFRTLPEDTLVLSKEKQSNFCKIAFWTLMAALFFAQTLTLLKSLFLTGIVLSLAWLVVGRIRPLKAYWRFLSIAFNLCFPPFLVALFWLLMDMPSDFETLFTLLFFIYLIYAVIEGRKGQFLPVPPSK
ncbi:MAG: DUF1189 family protein [Lentisphaeria bacterium]|nr:DUF1189 family protein [Lentisphaeria bacterium]